MVEASERARASATSNRRRGIGAALCAVLALMLFGFDVWQRLAIRAAFAPVRAQSTSNTDFAVRANAYVHDLYIEHLPSNLSYDVGPFEKYVPTMVMNRAGACGERSLLFLAALQAYDIPSRKLLIGVTERYASHIIVEAELDGQWRVFDPLYGYAYRRDDGVLATAEDIKEHPEILERAVQSDAAPRPFAYPTHLWTFNEITHFNWYRTGFLRWVRGVIGPAADGWSPPYLYYQRASIAGYVMLLVTLLLVRPFAVRAIRRRLGRRVRAGRSSSAPEFRPVEAQHR